MPTTKSSLSACVEHSVPGHVHCSQNLSCPKFHTIGVQFAPELELDELELDELLDELDSPASAGYSPVSIVDSEEHPTTNANKITMFFIGQ